ncbi:alpha/beta hydrolase [Amnibacterium setariae]|uniref:Alpha/beta hydrolase n=1 Tax=Amnibacterium setariae TaxID=2306585 RepID=A0A3A1TVJ6_9MICO|nr:alpha/beta hydrolase [Amnibacterium setariae]RIX28262.1 alpha/beta hydrolase [Amnibacterium setariae]
MSRSQREHLDALLRSAPGAPADESVEGMRRAFAALMAGFPASPEVGRSETVLGGRPALRLDPASPSIDGVLLAFHGGSYVLGSPATAAGLTSELVRRSGAPAISLDYRLAPEHPFPAAIEDGVAAYRELLHSGVQPGAILLVGDSAGGGLAVTTCLAARSAGLPMPAGILAFSPGLDQTRSGESMRTKAERDPLLSLDGIERTGRLYRGGHDATDPLLSPAVSADLHGLPPMLLQVGTNELLLDDSVRLAERARDAGVDVVLDVVADVPHVFPAFFAALEEADKALDRAVLFVQQRLRRRP